MTILTVPPRDETPWPTLGPLVCDFIEENLVYGPGDLRGEPAVTSLEQRFFLYRMYEVFPQGHPRAGRRRFNRCSLSLRKGLAKTEFAAWIAAVELHPDAPVRCDGFHKNGDLIWRPVRDPYIPLVAYTEDQTEELAYGALKTILELSPIAGDFDIGLERIMRRSGDGKAEALASSPNANDGARTTFQHFDEPLALDTPIPTPTGWTNMGLVEVGDRVFGSDGQICNIIGLGPIHENRDCYTVKLGDDSQIIADGSHRWQVFDHSPSFRCEREVTTHFMYEHQWAGRRRFTMPESPVLDLPNVELSIDPYVLGLWLGDGDSANATISVGDNDLKETQSLIENLGYSATPCRTTENKCPRLYINYPNPGYRRTVRHALKTLGVRGNKHIPLNYRRAGTEQRLALVQGLMDADGYIDENGYCTFSNANIALLVHMQELLRTLGYRPSRTWAIDGRWGEPKTIYKLHFPSSDLMPPFRLSRKYKHIRNTPIKNKRHWNVQKVEQVASVPVRCIAVDSEDHLFLAGDGMTPTHNTHRWSLPRLKEAHKVMLMNTAKRYEADPWTLETTTAYEPGSGSIAEDTMNYAKAIDGGSVKNASLFFFHRQAKEDAYDLEDEDGVRAALIEASGPAVEWTNIEAVIERWRDPTTDQNYFQQVWLNQPMRGADRAFDVEVWKALANPQDVPDGTLITLGFDGSRFHDSTALVATVVETGYQWPVGIWECPYGQTEWKVPVDEVNAVVEATFEKYEVWRMYCDPPYWEGPIADWAGKYGDKRVIEWRTNRTRQMCSALKAYKTAMDTGELSHSGDPSLTQHIGNAHRKYHNIRDEDGERLWWIQKERGDSPHKIDGAMGGTLSWDARGDAKREGAATHEWAFGAV